MADLPNTSARNNNNSNSNSNRSSDLSDLNSSFNELGEQLHEAILEGQAKKLKKLIEGSGGSVLNYHQVGTALNCYVVAFLTY